MDQMAVRVEFFGIARQRAGVSELSLDLPGSDARFGDALRALAARLPALAQELVVGGRLHESLTANLDGARFVSDPATPIRDGQCLLILSADAGG
jgi:molybdopterin converting factor small subunit